MQYRRGVFTDPQIATAGLTEAAAQPQDIAVQTRVLDLENVPRALANFDTRGFIKIMAEPDTGLLLCVQVVAEPLGS